MSKKHRSFTSSLLSRLLGLNGRRVLCRDTSDAAGLSPVPDEDEDEKSPEGNDADGTVTWQQASTVHGRKGQKNKKKKSEGMCESVSVDYLDNTLRDYR